MGWFQAATKAGTSSTAVTIRWAENELPGGSAVKQHAIFMTGTAQDFDSLSRVRSKGAGSPFVDVLETHLAALIAHFTKKAGPGATATRFSIPYTLGGGQGVVLGAQPEALAVELDTDGTAAAAGTFELGSLIGDPRTNFWPSYLGSAMNIAASSTRAGFVLTQTGAFLRGFCIEDPNDIDLIELNIGGKAQLLLTGDLLTEFADFSQGGTVTDPIFFSTPLLPLVPGASMLYFNTDGSWPGATAETSVLAFNQIAKQ